MSLGKGTAGREKDSAMADSSQWSCWLPGSGACVSEIFSIFSRFGGPVNSHIEFNKYVSIRLADFGWELRNRVVERGRQSPFNIRIDPRLELISTGRVIRGLRLVMSCRWRLLNGSRTRVSGLAQQQSWWFAGLWAVGLLGFRARWQKF